MNWILFGFKSCGKTYYGSRLGLPFLDTDQLIEDLERTTIREIIENKSESYFREVEKKVIHSLNPDNHVIAVGGGAVLDRDNLGYLQSIGRLIYLVCPKQTLKKRLLTPPIPTYLDPTDPEGSFEKMYSTRIEKYEKIPSYRLELEGKSDQEVVKELWEAINSETFFALQHGENPTGRQLEL